MEQRPDDYGIGRLFWVMNDAVVGADLATEEIVLWNPAAERLFGYPAEEALGMALDRLVPSELTDDHHGGIARYRDGGEPVIVGIDTVEVPAVTKDGQSRIIQLSLTDVKDDRRHVVALVRDLTEIRRAEAELQRLNTSMREFVATTSHDLRTPLTSMMGFAQTLNDLGDQLSDDEFRACLEGILRGSERAARLVDALFTLSQIEAGVISARAQNVVAADAAREAVSLSGTEAEVQIADDVTVRADADHFQRMVLNLLSNARHHGSPPLVVRADVVDGMVEILVSDHGPGVAAEFRPQLFDSFTRADPGGRRGAGLGLSIVRGLAEANDGEAFYRPRSDGSTFGVRLPLGR